MAHLCNSSMFLAVCEYAGNSRTQAHDSCFQQDTDDLDKSGWRSVGEASEQRRPV